jgi:DNA-binding PadR family transcriptional regulator
MTLRSLAQLAQLDQWVCWRWMKEDDADPKRPKRRAKPRTEGATKVPFTPQGKYASTADPATWSSHAACLEAARGGKKFDGVGFVFAEGGGLFGVDLDNCIQNDVDGRLVSREARGIIAELDSYAEISPSGTGVKIFCAGTVTDALKAKIADWDASIEVYGWGRFFTVTGDHYVKSPDQITNAEDAIRAIIARYRPAPKIPDRPATRQAIQDTGYQREWADRVLERATAIVSSAYTGGKHAARIKAARLAGGLIPLGLADEGTIINILYDAQQPTANHKQELRAITDGIAYGAANPLEAPAPPKQPCFDQGWALCPDHGRALQRSKNGNGWRCGVRDSSAASGFCAFWWRGDGYAPPAQIEAAPPLPAHARPINIIHASELASLPPTEWLIENELAARSVAMLYGASGTGKSFKTVDWAMRLGQTHTVLYVAAEGANGYNKRVMAWCEHHRASIGKTYFITHAINLMDHLYVESIIGAAAGLAPDLIIFDTMARSAEGADENSSRDMGIYHAACDRIKTELDCTVLYVHHTGKDGMAYRGSSALKGAADQVIALKKEDDQIILTWDKNKDEKDGQTQKITLLPVANSLVAVPTDSITDRYEAGLSSLQRTVLELLINPIFEYAGASSQQIKDGCDFSSTSAMYKVLGNLKRRGYIEQGGKREKYTITYKGHQALAGEPDETYKTVDGYGDADSDSAAADRTLLDIVAEKINALLFDEAQTLAAGVMSSSRQAAAMVRIQQLRIAHAEQAPLATSSGDPAVNVDNEALAIQHLDNALAGMAMDENADPRYVNNELADYEDICHRNGLTAVWHRRKPDYERADAWLTIHMPALEDGE